MVTLIKTEQIDCIDCDGPVRSGLAPALATRLQEMCTLREAALDWSDPEGVHKMRVASRRLRGALRDFEPYLGKRRIASTLKDLRQIARTLGRVRDHDVAIMTLERTASKAPREVAAGIRRFAELRNENRLEARARLVAVLTPESLSALNTKFKAVLEARPRDPEPLPPKQKVSAGGHFTYREVARSIILTRLAALEQLSKGLYRPLKTKPLHEMRIAAKHLRYALQLFSPCWGTPIALLAKNVAGLQSSLGKLHDCDVWIKDFGQTDKRDVRDLDFDHRATVAWLLCHFVKLRGKHLTTAMTQWQEWEKKELSSELRKRIDVGFSVSKS